MVKDEGRMITTTLEQSKRLKELGAPQRTTAFMFRKSGQEQYIQWTGNVEILESYSDIAAIYTLSELIDWLGHDFGILIMIDPDQWECHAGIIYPQDEAMKSEIGKTPLDAVYNLAIAVKSI